MILMFEDQRLSAFMKVDITWSIHDISTDSCFKRYIFLWVAKFEFSYSLVSM